MVKSYISSAAKPDLDWSQVRETVLMLNLAVAQIERGMKDGDESVTSLAKLFTGMAEKTNDLKKVLEDIPDHEDKPFVKKSFDEMSESMQTAIVAFQFYDTLCQRLSHVCNSLGALGDLIADSQRLYNPNEWNQLQALIRSKYNIDIDRQMFDAILKGATIEQVLAWGVKHRDQEKEKQDNVELF